MFLERLFDFPGFILELLTLSDPTFYHLLGLLAVITFLRLFLPLHLIMTREISKRNEIADLAEEEHCNEYDIFLKAHKFYYGSKQPETIKQDFIIYLRNWPDNYILPFYMRVFLEELKRDSSDARPGSVDKKINRSGDKAPANSTV